MVPAAALTLFITFTTWSPPAPGWEAAACAWPGTPSVVREEDRAVLLKWEFNLSHDLIGSELPDDRGYVEYREAIQEAGAALRHPITDDPPPQSQPDRDERQNWEMARSGDVGRIDPITCLEALVFSYQNARTPQLTKPTEFLVSVLRRDGPDGTLLTVLFGAGMEMFPPKSVYGLDVVEELVADGWTYWYALHNHTLQSNGDRIALGNPTMSTSDVQLTRALMRDLGLLEGRVTNGFYTFVGSPEDLARMRSR